MERAVNKAVKDVDYEIDRAASSLVSKNCNQDIKISTSEKITEANSYLDKADNHLKGIRKKYPEIPEKFIPLINKAVKKIENARQKVADWGVQEQERKKDAVIAGVESKTTQQNEMTAMNQDAAIIHSLYQRYYGKFARIRGGSLVYDMKLDEAEKALGTIRDAESTVPLFADDLGRLAGRYGKTASDIYNTFHARGFTLKNSEEREMAALIDTVHKLKQTRQSTAAVIADNVRSLLTAFSNQFNDARLKRIGDAKKLLVIGQQIDPKNNDISNMLTDIDDQLAEVAEKMNEMINAATWKGNVADFSGPGDATALAGQAKKYFQNNRDWGGKPGRRIEILDVSVRGPWKVAETDAFGRVTRWRLPIHVAITDEKLRSKNIARVYDLSIVAMEGAPGRAVQKPPFDGYWVGDSWMMRLDKL